MEKERVERVFFLLFAAAPVCYRGRWRTKGEASGCFGGNRSVPGNENRPVFTYQTRVSVTAEQDQMLRE